MSVIALVTVNFVNRVCLLPNTPYGSLASTLSQGLSTGIVCYNAPRGDLIRYISVHLIIAPPECFLFGTNAQISLIKY